MASNAFHRIALIGKLRTPEIAASLIELRSFLGERGCEVLIERETAVHLGVGGVDFEAIGRANCSGWFEFSVTIPS